jgi:hypothetical protein
LCVVGVAKKRADGYVGVGRKKKEAGVPGVNKREEEDTPIHMSG